VTYHLFSIFNICLFCLTAIHYRLLVNKYYQ